MKNLPGILFCLLWTLNVFSQGFSKAEYFFDTDPGVNNATTIILTEPTDVVNFSASIPVTSLSNGFHNLGIRVFHNDGLWSLFETRRFYIASPAEADVFDIVAAEYFFNTDPGKGNATPIIITPGSTVNFSPTIPVALGPGFHFLAIRVMDAEGKWSLFESRRFYIASPASSDVTDITDAEYFFNADPGVGNGTPIPVTDGSTVNFSPSIPVSLSEGFHYLCIRVKDSEGKWGMFESRRFYISSPVSTDVTDVVEAEYFIDTDPGNGSATPLSVGTSGGTIAFLASIPASLSQGFHHLAIRVKDSEGKWGLFESRRFYIQTPTSDMPVITSAEYYFDNDPGVGNGFPLTVPAPDDNVNFNAEILMPCLTNGQHFVGLRVKDEDNHWSLIMHDTITQLNSVVAAVLPVPEPDSINLGQFTSVTPPDLSGFTYQWLMNGSTISGATSQNYGAGLTGNYSVIRTCNGNSATSNEVTVYAFLNLDLKLFIEGYYRSAGLMDNFGSGGCLFVCAGSSDPTDADTVFVTLFDPGTMLPQHFDTVIVKTDGTALSKYTDFTVQGESHYIQLKHRNAVETWSANPVVMNAFTNYDFTTAQTQAFGNNMVQTPDMTGWAIYSGDINQDGAIDGSDFLDIDVSIQSGDGGYAVGDLNGDGSVDGSDFLILDPNIQLGVGAVIP